jgi:hypothetical protein
VLDCWRAVVTSYPHYTTIFVGYSLVPFLMVKSGWNHMKCLITGGWGRWRFLTPFHTFSLRKKLPGALQSGRRDFNLWHGASCGATPRAAVVGQSQRFIGGRQGDLIGYDLTNMLPCRTCIHVIMNGNILEFGFDMIWPSKGIHGVVVVVIKGSVVFLKGILT